MEEKDECPDFSDLLPEIPFHQPCTLADLQDLPGVVVVAIDGEYLDCDESDVSLRAKIANHSRRKAWEDYAGDRVLCAIPMYTNGMHALAIKQMVLNAHPLRFLKQG